MFDNIPGEMRRLPHWPLGIIKRWEEQRHFGITYGVIEGKPEFLRKVSFDIGAARRPVELEQALNVRVGDNVGGAM